MQPQVAMPGEGDETPVRCDKLTANQVRCNVDKLTAERATKLVEQDARRPLGRGRTQCQRRLSRQGIAGRWPGPRLGGQSLRSFCSESGGHGFDCGQTAVAMNFDFPRTNQPDHKFFGCAAGVPKTSDNNTSGRKICQRPAGGGLESSADDLDRSEAANGNGRDCAPARWRDDGKNGGLAHA
jgi:hypothetical protein